MIPAGTVERGERKRTADEVSKADWGAAEPLCVSALRVSIVAAEPVARQNGQNEGL
jgi:hypothetical protein